MPRHLRLFLIAFLMVSFLPCYAHHLAVVVDKDNNVGQVSSNVLAKMFKSEVRKWPDGKNVVIILHKSSSLEMLVLERLNKMTEAELKAFISAHKSMFVIADSDAALLKAVQSTPGALGLIDVRVVDGKVNVLKVDGKLPLEDGYLPH